MIRALTLCFLDSVNALSFFPPVLGFEEHDTV